MKHEKKALLENIVSLGALQIVGYIIPFINLPYLSRVLGAEKFGLVFFAFAFMGYFMMLTDYGFGLSATREVAVNRHNQKSIDNIFSSVISIKFLLLLVSYIILNISVLLIPKLHDNWLIFQLSFLMVVGNALFPVWFFQGMEKMKYITFLNILSKVIFVGLIFIFVKNESDYIVVPLFNSLGFLIAGLVGFIFAIREFKIKLYIPKLQSIKKQFKYSTEFFLSRVSASCYTNTNAFCLGLIGSNVMVGYYVAAEKLYNAISYIIHPISTALYPYVSKYKDIKLYKKILKISLCIIILMCSFVFIFSKSIVNIFYGAGMIEAYKVLKIFCFAMLATTPSRLIGYPLLGALGHTKVANGSIIFASVFHIIGLFILFITTNMNIYSIASMVVLSETIVLLIRIYSVHRYKLLKEEICCNG